jgi:hypothetical protein
MPSHAELAARLLSDSAGFFRTLGSQNPDLEQQMTENAGVFEQMSTLLQEDPNGNLNGTPYAELAGRLLKDAAEFFRSLASQNEPIKEQMEENADVFEQISTLVMQDPNGILD